MTGVEAAPYYFTRSGNYSWGYDSPGYYALYWSRTPNIDINDFAIGFSYYSSYFYPQYGGGKVRGASVRCVFGS